MKKILSLCMIIGLTSCGGNDFTGGDVAPDVSDSSDKETSADASDSGTPDTDVPDVAMADAPDVDSSDTNLPDTGLPDVAETSVVPDSATENVGCTPGELSCQGKTPTLCDANGQLQTKPECTFLCTDGMCTGECNPGEEQCLVDKVEHCDVNGNWVLDRVCPKNCVQNTCLQVWCCEYNDNPYNDASCLCNSYQVCDISTGFMDSCPAYPCCWIQNNTEDCICSDKLDQSCEDYIDLLLGEPFGVYKRVDSCPSK